ncbi:MAG: hypothetical protein L6Q97_22025, partial [Thermoanaerobaculia bacterium]|nr:hypothetical protein [Thermoanaerobaculia bacterium]
QLAGDVQMQLLREQVSHALRDSGDGGKSNKSFWLGGLTALLLLCIAGYFLFLPGKTTNIPGNPPSTDTPPPQQSVPAVPGTAPENRDE